NRAPSAAPSQMRPEASSAEHARAVEQERARIARNIHDDVGASLTRISLLTQAALDESSAHSPTLEKIYESTRTITRSMDEIVWAVNPRHDNTESLVYYLGNFAQSFLGTAGIRCRLESPTHLPDATLTSQIRHHVFLCCKEALHNVVKHAGASEAVIHIALEHGVLEIRITDNGRGIAAAGDGGHTAIGDGLENMRQRMAEIRGTCAIKREPAGGTTVVFSVPLDQTPAV
ncbi:MAG: histidine kinase, partial [Pedosphaera parvula]|nr:histidine kinase [Pedosphaera parvula]